MTDAKTRADEEDRGAMSRRGFLAASGLSLAALAMSASPEAAELPVLSAAEAAPASPDLFWDMSGEAGLCSAWDGMSLEELRMYAD